ncbi:CAAX amino protease [Bacteroidia bacterium]|nr:CAAX amino protease [Bacteroidia bacterium]
MEAAVKTKTIGYNRLRAYIDPLQFKERKKDSRFVRKNIHFQEIINLYKLDSSLRWLIFRAIEKIEVAIRTRIAYEYAMETNESHWFMNPTLYHKKEDFTKILGKIEENVKRSDEEFITYYRQKYDVPALPPAWMSLEILSFGGLGKLLAALKNQTKPKARVAEAFGLPNATILVNWILAIAALRNYCAHHSRIWNRRFMLIVLPYSTHKPFIDSHIIKSQTIKPNKIFALLCCIKYLLNGIDHNNDFYKELKTILASGGRLLNLKEMGFPPDWETFPVWKE